MEVICTGQVSFLIWEGFNFQVAQAGHKFVVQTVTFCLVVFVIYSPLYELAVSLCFRCIV